MEAKVPERDIQFELQGPDDDNCIWICSAKGKADWCQNLGPKDKVAKALFQWLQSVGDWPDAQFWAPLWAKGTD